MPEKNSNLVIVIPAFNEEENIGRTIDLIRKTGINAEIVVVNDGSLDKTSVIAKEKGCFVIDMKKYFKKPDAFAKGYHKLGAERNFGKSNAVFAGLRESLKRNPKAVLTIDADMTKVPSDALNELINKGIKGTTQKQTLMFVAPCMQGSNPKTISHNAEFSGLRSFTVAAVYKILHSKLKKATVGYGFEIFLNKLFPKSTIYLGYKGFNSLDSGLNRRADTKTRYIRTFIEIQKTKRNFGGDSIKRRPKRQKKVIL